jgi:peptide/nickel transport system permease protein
LLGHRLAQGLTLVVGVTLISFVLVQVVPGDPATANLGQRAIEDPQAVASFRERYGLNQPVPLQYLSFLVRLVHGDLGVSQRTGRPVATDLGQFLPATLELAAAAITLAILLGVSLGIIAALLRDRWPDRLLRLVSVVSVSTPTFWSALLAFYLIFFRLGWFPGTGRLYAGEQAPSQRTGLLTVDALLDGDLGTFRSAAAHLVLPALVLAVSTVGTLLRFTRASVLDVLGNEYVSAARAKGLGAYRVIGVHVLRPALLGLVTVVGLAFGNLLSGTILVEQVFSWPGLGSYAYNSAVNLDLPGVMGVSLAVALIYVMVNTAVDIAYLYIDPRVSLR